MSKKTNSFIILTIILGSAFLMPTNVFATEIFPGTALEFDGTDDYISTTLMDLSGSEITIEYWFKGSSTQSAVRQQTAGDNFIVSGWSDLHILSNDGGVAGGLSIGASAEDGNWHHIAFTWKQNTTDGFVSYLDGQIVASRTSSDIPIPNHNTNLIFGSYIGASEFLDGALDEIRIWSVERTQTEIQDNRFVELTGSETGLIGYWKFNEGSGTTAYDSANGYDGSLNNMDPINSWILTCLIDDSQGSALDFDGIDDYVEIPDDNSLDLTTNYTIETWIKPESFSSLAGMVTKYHIAGSNGYLLRLHSDAPYTGFCFDEMYTSTGILEQDNWYHIAAVNDNGTRKIYLNGVEQTLTGTPLTVAANSDPVCLGVDYLDAGRYFNGDMDEVRIWNVARTRQEICQSMHSTLEGTESNLVSYFQFNEGEGDIAHDVVSGNNGLLNNMTNDDWIDSTVPFGETFGGTISSNTVWDAETIYIYDDVFINDGVTLTIDPGTTVMFQGYYKLDVQGRILAVGTGTDSIKFTADPSVNWQGIRFDSTPTTNDSTMFEYCLFENGIGPWTHNDKKGGSIYAGSFSKISINHCSFSNNYADLGGALSFYNSSPVITNSYFSGNSAQYGGAYYGSGSSASFLYCTFENNSAVANDYGYYGEGGAISCRYSGVMDISYCFFLDNTADNKGGAISLETSLILRSCVIANNTSGDTGGGFNCNGGSMSMYNCTITENVAQNYGSGINFESTSYPHLHNCIIYGNHADAGQISILDTDGAQYFHYCNIEGGFDAFIGAGSGVNFNGTYEFCIDSDPGFTDSSNNDYSLLNTSHCINGGNPGLPISLIGEFDLAGNNRIFDSSIGSDELNDALDRVDIGAYEYSSESGIIPAGTTIYHNQVINSNLYVLQDFTFTIAQGKTLEFDQGAGMFIYGSLDANGESYQLITFTASNESNGWSGLNFISSTGAAPTSNLEYCIIEYGDGETSGEQANGGNIFVKDYDEITLLNCRIKSGNAENGGSIYCENSKINLFNCILNNNQADQSGGAIFAHHSESSLINLTIVDNSAGTDGGGLAFSDELYSQPEIKNCIIWDNGIAPIIPGNGLLTDVAYCDIEYPYPGSNNISSDPVFTGEADNPYNIANYSYCLNAGVQDTTGLNLPAIDILGYPRIFGHTDPAYDRIDIGAYECQEIFAPFNFSASDGDNYFPGYVQLYWNYNPDYEPAPETFTIGRNGMPINVIDGQTYYYSDYTAVPGQVYSYQIAAIAGDQSNLSLEDSGYLKPNGIISGTVLSANNNPVQGVKISLDPSPGFCLEFDSSAPSSLTIENPEVNMDFNFTIEFWVKTALSDVILLNKGNHNFSVNASGKVEYTDGTNTIIQDSLSVNDNEWHHLAVVNDYTNSRTFLYFDEYKVASDTTFVFSGSSDAGFSTSTSFSGFLDNIIIWTAARDSSDIVEGMNIITAWDEPGLAGYWPLNEGIGTSVFDATNFAHNGSIIDCDWSFPDAGVLLGAFTDEWGNYIVSQIYYGASTTFAVTPSKPGHIFQPEQRQVTLSESNIAQNDINFTDNSLIPITGYVKFQNTECPVVGATILLNGSPALPIVLTNEDGYYVMEVEHGTECIVTVDYSGHIFNREWHLGVVTFPQTDINFEDTYKTQFRCEVVGGDDAYPIGEFDVTLLSVCGCYLDEITGENWSSGSIMITNLPPLDYNVTVDPAGNDPFNLAIDDQFQSMKTDLISLTNPDSLLDTLRFVWKADLEIEVTWADTLILQHFPEYPESEFYVLSQNEWCEVTVKAFEDYSYDGHPNQITYLDDCDLVITDEVGTQGITETAFEDTTVFTYTFAPYLPNILSGYSRQYQNMLEITVRDLDLNRFATQTDWIFTEGVKPLESTYATISPEIPFLILHDPPGDGSSSTFGQSSSHSVAFGTSVCTDDEHNIFSKVHLGADITISVGGFFFSVESKIKITADFNFGLTLGTSQTQSMEHEYTFTTSSEYSTSDEGMVIGDGSDVFVGGAMNLIWGVTNELYWDDIEQAVIIDTSVMVTPNGFATVYIYTDKQIRNTVIPNLEAIGDTTSIALWNTFLENNENNKANAVPNPNHPDNLSFNAGAGYSYEEETSITNSQTIEFKSTVSTEFGALIGMTVN